MHTLASSKVKCFPQERNIQLNHLFEKASRTATANLNACDSSRSKCRFFGRNFTSRVNNHILKILTIFRYCHHIQPPSLEVKVDFAMVGIVSKRSPSLFSLLTKTTQLSRRVIQLQISLIMLARRRPLIIYDDKIKCIRRA